MTEVWKPVVGYEDSYEVSNLGRIKSLERSVPRGDHFQRVGRRILKPVMGTSGYYQIGLHASRKKKIFTIHQLVAAAFIGPRPDGHEVRHKDGAVGNNRSDNLEYGTSAENGQDMVEHGRSTRGTKHSQAKLTEAGVWEIRRRLATGETQKAIAVSYGVTQPTVGRIKRRECWGWLQ